MKRIKVQRQEEEKRGDRHMICGELVEDNFASWKEANLKERGILGNEKAVPEEYPAR